MQHRAEKQRLTKRIKQDIKQVKQVARQRAKQKTRRVWAILCLAVKKFLRIDGVQWAGAFAFLILVWVALQCFITLIFVTNRAWGIAVYNWWRLPPCAPLRPKGVQRRRKMMITSAIAYPGLKIIIRILMNNRIQPAKTVANKLFI
jgi:hypothetical protein